MPSTKSGLNSLVLYKNKPALVKRPGGKLEILLQDGRTLSVRPKDVIDLHPGPVESFADLEPAAGEVMAAWELLAGSTTTLAELADLAYGEFTAAAACALWEWMLDGLYFSGSPDVITVHTAQEVAETQATRELKAAQALAWSDFLGRVSQGTYLPEDRQFLDEVEELALQTRDHSRVLKELGRAQTAENAHALLLELGYWDPTIDPHPLRVQVPTSTPSMPLPALPDQERVDLTQLAAYAIDDAGVVDPDDALSLDGDRLWVHVADVAALVHPDSPADMEARGRGANLYLPEGTIPMLPAAATAQLGLGLAETSPALSFGLDVDQDGDIAGVEVVPSWIKATRLTYDEAEQLLDRPPFNEMVALTQLFQARRQGNGAVSIDLPEVKIQVDAERVRILPLPSLASRSLVREAMLMAGEAAAHFALEAEIPIAYAIQDSPDEIDLPDTLSGMFARRRTLQRSQQSTLPGPHAGLGLELYVRVTSPLRRYLDLVAHQQLRAYVRNEPLLDGQAVLERVGAAEAVTNGVRHAERLARQHWTLVFLLQNPDWRGQGVLVDKSGLRGTVLIPELGWEARIHLREDIPLDSVITLALQEVNLPALDAYFRVEAES